MARTGTTKAQGQKHALDKFYTKPSVALALIDRVDLDAYDLIIEPSAGGGAFSNELHRRRPGAVQAFDLAPEADGITEADWFTHTTRGPANTLVIGNPPFGQQCSLAIRFINHAFDVVGARTVAFVLPRSFRKASVTNRVTRNAELVDDVTVEANAFLLDGADYDLRCVFQVWERTATPRQLRLGPVASRHLAFTRKDEPHDFAMRRVGGKAGHAFRDDESSSAQSNYFLRVTDRSVDVDAVIEMLNALDWSVADDGTGPRTLAKRELVAVIDDAYPGRFGVGGAVTLLDVIEDSGS